MVNATKPLFVMQQATIQASLAGRVSEYKLAWLFALLLAAGNFVFAFVRLMCVDSGNAQAALFVAMLIHAYVGSLCGSKTLAVYKLRTSVIEDTIPAEVPSLRTYYVFLGILMLFLIVHLIGAISGFL